MSECTQTGKQILSMNSSVIQIRTAYEFVEHMNSYIIHQNIHEFIIYMNSCIIDATATSSQGVYSPLIGQILQTFPFWNIIPTHVGIWY
jgi:hypothetical protein